MEIINYKMIHLCFLIISLLIVILVLFKYLCERSLNKTIFKDYDEQVEFEKWAFGCTNIRYDISAMYTWNSRHGDKFYLKSSYSMEESMEAMYKLWKEKVESDYNNINTNP